jgi:PHD/YefM family antitoxin component YafN of YafNO toxin-antitoxin module
MRPAAMSAIKESPMTTVSVTDLRDHLPDRIDDVRFTKERILVRRHKKDVAALVSVEDARLLEALEDLIDLDAARAALADYERDGASMTVEAFRKELGL